VEKLFELFETKSTLNLEGCQDVFPLVIGLREKGTYAIKIGNLKGDWSFLGTSFRSKDPPMAMPERIENSCLVGLS